MNRNSLSRTAAWAGALFAVAALAPAVHGQTAFGVNAAGTLFKFNVTNPSAVTTIGPVGFLPEGIDFRPSSQLLYAIDVTATTTQLYSLNITTGAATAVGAGFASFGGVAPADYDLRGNQTFGFDFNPTTLQGDGSMRIRLVSTNGENLRLNSSTGGLAASDTNLLIGTNAPFVDAAAYANNIAQAGGTTTLYDMDSRNNSLYTQNPPNNGTLNLVGPFGASINNTQQNIGFDIYTTTLGGPDSAYAVLKRPDVPVGGPLGSYLLYSVNLGTGAITNGALVGPVATPFDFVGGFAVMPIPEPTALALLAAVVPVLLRRRRSGG